jgi:hypothetical protein
VDSGCDLRFIYSGSVSLLEEGLREVTKFKGTPMYRLLFSTSDCFTSKRDELRLGQDLTEGNERKVTMKKPKDH